MVTEEHIKKSLKAVVVPAKKRSIDELNLFRRISVSEDMVKITLASTGLSSEDQNWIKARTKDVIEKLPEVKNVAVDFTEVKPVEMNMVSHIIAVMSGKGGVGKSLMAGLMAVGLKRQGFKVGILDADITGPSIPRMFGISQRPLASESGMLPVPSSSGIEVMSINLLLPNEDDAVIWRGPLIGKIITQFWEEVVWGKLDYLIVDLPPGTADAPLTVMQTLPISGVIIVFTPQDLTAMVVRKAVKMAEHMGKSVLGVIENMSYLYVPEIDKRIEPFGKSRGEEMASAAHAPLLGQLPIDPQLSILCDEGSIEQYNGKIVKSFAISISRLLPVKVDQGSRRKGNK